MFWKRLALFGFSAVLFASTASAQESRPRRAVGNPPDSLVKSQPIVVPSVSVKQFSAPPAAVEPRSLISSTVYSQPATRGGLTTEPLIRTTAISRPAATATANTAAKPVAATAAMVQGRLLESMNSWYGTPYHYGSEGPVSIDCSALVWRVFGAAGVNFTRTSARNYWNEFPVATEEEKSQFGTLVFFNDLGHVGIVVDADTFYHASSSKGATYSKFSGYWEKRIVGFRRVPLAQLQTIANQTGSSKN